eukprot:Lankesteria_metandrocarpae@DN7352_c0_g1_i1.p1
MIICGTIRLLFIATVLKSACGRPRGEVFTFVSPNLEYCTFSGDLQITIEPLPDDTCSVHACQVTTKHLFIPNKVNDCKEFFDGPDYILRGRDVATNTKVISDTATMIAKALNWFLVKNSFYSGRNNRRIFPCNSFPTPLPYGSQLAVFEVAALHASIRLEFKRLHDGKCGVISCTATIGRSYHYHYTEDCKALFPFPDYTLASGPAGDSSAILVDHLRSYIANEAPMDNVTGLPLQQCAPAHFSNHTDSHLVRLYVTNGRVDLEFQYMPDGMCRVLACTAFVSIYKTPVECHSLYAAPLHVLSLYLDEHGRARFPQYAQTMIASLLQTYIEEKRPVDQDGNLLPMCKPSKMTIYRTNKHKRMAY